MKKAILWFFLAYALNLTAYNFYSPAIRLEKVNSSNTKVELQHQNLIVNSEKIIKDSTSLNKPQDYEIDYSSGTINFHQDYGFVLVEYAIYPEKLLREFSSFTVQTLADSEKVQLKRPVFSQVYDDTQLNVSGSKTFKVSVANNEDFALDQSLFLKIDGKLGNNLFITAQLTDSQSPITPEGDSRELSNLDKVFLKLYGKNYDISFGDLEASFNQTRFINYQTKFEGLKASWTGKNEIMGALAISKGKQATDTFSGTEGKQGPYYLSVNNISGVQVVSGSETVYLNGNKLSRGSSYTIDYSEGSVTFTNENFIDSNSFIQVDFQYSDEEYNQNMYLASSKVDFSSLAFLENLQMKTFMIIQNDDKDNPLQQTFSESDKQALAEAGDSEAWVSGVTQVEVGEGLYIKVEEGDLEYYEYVGSQANGEYIIHFTYVGSGGDYEVAEEGYYIFVGDGQGSYSPIKKLITPEFKANYDVILNYKKNWWEVNLESLLSDHDKNTFSSKDDSDNTGLAAFANVSIHPDWDNLRPQLALKYSRTNENLSTFTQRTSAIQNYELSTIPDSLASSEYELELNMEIFKQIKPAIMLQYKDAEKEITQKYLSANISSRQLSYLPEINYRLLAWQQDYKNENLNIYSANFIKLYQHNLQALYKWQNFSLGSGYFNKQRENDSELMEFKGDRITKLKGNFSYSKDNKVSATLHWQQEVNDSLSTTWKQKEKANTYGISSYWNTSNHQFDVDISRRTTQQESYDMAEIRVSNSFWQQALDSDFTYSLQNVEFYPKQRELVYVGEEYGLYDSTGTYSDDGEYIWEVTDIDYDNPQLSVEVNANFNLYFKPAQLTKGFAKRFETETNVIVTENSKADDKTSIYFLNPNALMKKGSTLYGKNSLFQNVWIDIWHRRLTAKLGFQYDKILDNRYQSEQISRYNQWEASLRSRMIKDNDVELSYFYTEEEDSYYHSRIDKNEIQLDIRSNLPSSLVLTTEMSYDKEVGSSNLGEGSYNIKSWDISENLTYFGSNRYRIFGRLLYRKNWRSGSGFLGYLPEKREGNIWNWKFNFNYKINKFTSTSLEYNGDSYPNQDTKHEIQVELKAEF